MKNFISSIKKNLNLVIFALLLAVFITITTISLSTPIPPYTDDTFIFLRYARNIVSGYGFVWNIGTPPVEGYSSFLFLIILVLSFKIGLTNISIAGFIGILCSIFTLIELYYLLRKFNKFHRWFNLLAVAVIAFSPHFLYWTTSGMDEPLFAAGLLLCVLVSLKYIEHKISSIAVGFTFSLLTLIRPEGIGYFLFFIFFLFLLEFINHRNLPVKNAFILGIGFLIIYLPYFIWRLFYFKTFFPNTYYDKTGGGSYQYIGGWVYSIQSITSFFNFAFLLLLFIALIFYIDKIIKDKGLTVITTNLLLILGFILSCFVFTIWEGGDHFGHARFLLPVFPLIIIFVSSMDSYFFVSLQRKWEVPIIIGIVFLSLFASWRSDIIYSWCKNDISYLYKTNFLHEKKITYNRDTGITTFLLMSQALNSVSNNNQSIAAVPVGTIGYFTNLKVYDMLGLVDPIIAKEPFDQEYIQTWRPGHDKGDGDYILSLKPDFIEINDSLTEQPEPNPDEFMLQYKSIDEIWNNSSFHKQYVFFPLVTSNGKYYNLYKRISN